jgi:hypothetical protein
MSVHPWIRAGSMIALVSLGARPTATAQDPPTATPVPEDLRDDVERLRAHVRSMFRWSCQAVWEEDTRDSVAVTGWSTPRCERPAAELYRGGNATAYAVAAELSAMLGRGRRRFGAPLDGLWSMAFPGIQGASWDLVGELDALTRARLILDVAGHATAARSQDIVALSLDGLASLLELPPEGLLLDAPAVRPRPSSRTVAWYRTFVGPHRTQAALRRAIDDAWMSARDSADAGLRLALALRSPRRHADYLRELLCDPATPEHVRSHVAAAPLDDEYQPVRALIDPCMGEPDARSCPGAPTPVCER